MTPPTCMLLSPCVIIQVIGQRLTIVELTKCILGCKLAVSLLVGFSKKYLEMFFVCLLWTLGRDGTRLALFFTFGRSRLESGSPGFVVTKSQRSWIFRRWNFNPHWNYVIRVDITSNGRWHNHAKGSNVGWSAPYPLTVNIDTNGLKLRQLWVPALEPEPACNPRTNFTSRDWKTLTWTAI